MNLSNLTYVFVSCGCSNWLSQAWWLRGTEVHSLSFEFREPESVRLKSGYWQGCATSEECRRLCPWFLPASGGCWHALACSPTIPVSACLSSHCLLCVSPPSARWLLDNLVLPIYLKSCKVNTSAKTSPRKRTVTGPRVWDLSLQKLPSRLQLTTVEFAKWWFFCFHHSFFSCTCLIVDCYENFCYVSCNLLLAFIFLFKLFQIWPLVISIL